MRSEIPTARMVITDDEADIRRLLAFLLRVYEMYEAPHEWQARPMLS